MVDKKRKHPKEIVKAEANSLNFSYADGTQALKKISLPVYENKITALIGPSGMFSFFIYHLIFFLMLYRILIANPFINNVNKIIIAPVAAAFTWNAICGLEIQLNI